MKKLLLTALLLAVAFSGTMTTTEGSTTDEGTTLTEETTTEEGIENESSEGENDVMPLGGLCDLFDCWGV